MTSPLMTASLNEDLKQLDHELTRGREDVGRDKRPQQTTAARHGIPTYVEFLKEAKDATRSFYATQAGACCQTNHYDDHNIIQGECGMWCKSKKPILALNQQPNTS